jgi:hypothetical protein
MEHWISVDIQRRREELHAEAVRSRMIRMLESGRSRTLRARIADGAESLSELLAGLARVMRSDEA